MTRLLRLLAFYFVGVFLGGAAVVGSARAETIPATQQQVVDSYGIYYFGQTAGGTTALAACQDYYNRYYYPAYQTMCGVTGSEGSYVCNIAQNEYGGGCPATGMLKVGITTYYRQELGCPASGGWTLSGSNCTRPDCAAGQVRSETGSCVYSTCGVAQSQVTGGGCACPPAGQSAMIGGATAWGITGSSSACQSGASYGGCKMACTSGVSSGGQASCTGCKFTGEESTRTADGMPAADTTKPIGELPQQPTTEDLIRDCLGRGMGYVQVNGTVTCMSATESPNAVTQTATERIVSVTPLGETVTDKATTTQCQGGNCTQTTTTTQGGETSSNTTTTDAATFCQKNPTAPLCLKQTTDECKANPGSLACSSLGDAPTAETGPADKSIGVESITAVNMGSGNSTCPADVQLAHGVTFSYASLCGALSWLKPLVLALAWLSAGLIVLGAVRNG